jgi:hypothetical protein
MNKASGHDLVMQSVTPLDLATMEQAVRRVMDQPDAPLLLDILGLSDLIGA